jgi:hypothetical protein
MGMFDAKWTPANGRGVRLKQGERCRMAWPKKDAMVGAKADPEPDWKEGTVDVEAGVVRLDCGTFKINKAALQVLRGGAQRSERFT